MERSVHDALCVVKRVLESHLVVPGGGAVETALSVYLENFARTLVGGAGGLVSIFIPTYCIVLKLSKLGMNWGLGLIGA